MRFGPLLLLLAVLRAPAATPAWSPAEARSFLNKNCVACHNATAKAGGLDLVAIQINQKPAVWSKVALRVHNGEMPPKSRIPIEQR